MPAVRMENIPWSLQQRSRILILLDITLTCQGLSQSRGIGKAPSQAPTKLQPVVIWRDVSHTDIALKNHKSTNHHFAEKRIINSSYRQSTDLSKYRVTNKHWQITNKLLRCLMLSISLRETLLMQKSLLYKHKSHPWTPIPNNSYGPS